MAKIKTKAEKTANASKLPALTIDEPAPVAELVSVKPAKKEKKSKKEKKHELLPEVQDAARNVAVAAAAERLLNPPDAESKEVTEDGGQQYRIYLRPQQVEWLQKRYGANLPPTRLIALLLVETEACHKAQDLVGFAKFLKKEKSESKLGGALSKLLNEYINK